MTSILEALRGFAREGQILTDEPMSRHTTFRLGGPADVLFMPDSAEQVARALEAARALGTPVLVIGNGSNLLVRDGGVRGLVVALGEAYSDVSREGMSSRPRPAPRWRGWRRSPRPADWRDWSSPRASRVRWAAAAR